MTDITQEIRAALEQRPLWSNAEAATRFGALLGRVLTEIESQRGADPPPSAVRRNAERYLWLRNQTWDESAVAVVTEPKQHIKLGAYCPSGELLDNFIDAAQAVTQPRGGK